MYNSIALLSRSQITNVSRIGTEFQTVSVVILLGGQYACAGVN